MKTVITFDGACLGNPGPGGWAALIRDASGERLVSGAERNTTNNRMELLAAICGLESAEVADVVMVGDSQYVVKGFSEWLPGWKRKNWKRGTKPVANVDLWQALDAAVARHRSVTWTWVRGHNGHADNERVDAAASAEAARLQRSHR